jgi:tetratricopeptide (TPR) repeat protein
MTWRLTPVNRREAHLCAEEALSLCRQIGDRWQIAECDTYLGILAWFRAHLTEAREHTEAALVAFDQLGDRRMQVLPKIIMGWILQSEGDLAAAERLRYEALALCREVGDRTHLIYCHTDLAVTLTLRDQYDEALVYGQRGVALCLEYGQRDREGLARHYLAFALLHVGRFADAGKELELASRLARETGNRDIEGEMQTALGRLALIEGFNNSDPRALLHNGLHIAAETEDRIGYGGPLSGMVIASCKAGDLVMARRYLLECLRFAWETREYIGLLELLPALALYLVRQGELTRGLSIWALARTSPYVANSRWYEQVVGREIEELTASLPQEEAETAARRGRELDPWSTIASILAQF